MERILVVVDGSQAALRALGFAAGLAGRYNAELIVLAMAEAAGGEAAGDGAGVEAARPAGVETVLAGARVAAWAQGAVRVASLAGFGDPVAAIVDCARERRADLVVLGRTRAGRFAGLLRGGLQSRVLAEAPCPVTIAC